MQPLLGKKKSTQEQRLWISGQSLHFTNSNGSNVKRNDADVEVGKTWMMKQARFNRCFNSISLEKIRLSSENTQWQALKMPLNSWKCMPPLNRCMPARCNLICLPKQVMAASCSVALHRKTKSFLQTFDVDGSMSVVCRFSESRSSLQANQIIKGKCDELQDYTCPCSSLRPSFVLS